MFISVLELFKIGIGPSSSHTMGPMLAACDFRQRVERLLQEAPPSGPLRVRCILKGSLAWTGKGHATDRAITLGLHGHSPEAVAREDVEALLAGLEKRDRLRLTNGTVAFSPPRISCSTRANPCPSTPTA